MSNSATPWSVDWQAPLLMGFSRQQYWSGLPFSFWLRNQTHISCISCIGRWILYHCTNRKASTTLGSPIFFQNTQAHRVFCKSPITPLLCTKPQWNSWEQPHHCSLSCLSSLPPHWPICCLNNLWRRQTVLISSCHYDKLPQTQWLKTTKIHYLTA